MRHAKRVKKLGLRKEHREALLRNLMVSLIMSERMKTTKARAKVLSAKFARLMHVVQTKEPREAIRLIKSYLPVEASSRKLFTDLKKRYEKRSSGFTRVVHIGRRKGDNAPLVQISLL